MAPAGVAIIIRLIDGARRVVPAPPRQQHEQIGQIVDMDDREAPTRRQQHEAAPRHLEQFEQFGVARTEDCGRADPSSSRAHFWPRAAPLRPWTSHSRKAAARARRARRRGRAVGPLARAIAATRAAVPVAFAGLESRARRRVDHPGDMDDGIGSRDEHIERGMIFEVAGDPLQPRARAPAGAA